MAADVIVVGSINADLVIRVPRLPRPGETVSGYNFKVFGGGKGANQALAVARLGGRVRLIGNVGTDDFGAMVVKSLASGGRQCLARRMAARCSYGRRSDHGG